MPLAWLNERPFKKLEGSRASLFADLDRPALRPLPECAYEYATWKQAQVNIDYHVEWERHYYSVPYQLVGERADVRATAVTIEWTKPERRTWDRGDRSGRQGPRKEGSDWTMSRLAR